jgi:hypothetical protein
VAGKAEGVLVEEYGHVLGFAGADVWGEYECYDADFGDS